MYNIGDQVVYPMHGAGIIDAIEDHEVLGETKKYYILAMPIGSMRVMVPLDSSMGIGLRPVISEEEGKRVVRILEGEESKMSQNWSHRYRENMEKIRSGDVFLVAEVVRNLSLRDRGKGLSTGEKKMLDTARQILVSELVLSLTCTEEEVLALLETALG